MPARQSSSLAISLLVCGLAIPVAIGASSENPPPKVAPPPTVAIPAELSIKLDEIRTEALKSLAKNPDKAAPAPKLPLVLPGLEKSVTLPVPMLTTHTVTEQITRTVIEEVIEKVKDTRKITKLLPRFKKVLGVPVPLPPNPIEIVEEFVKEVKRQVPKQIVEDVKKKVEKLIDATKVKFSCRVELTNLVLKMQNNQMTCVAEARFVIQAKPLQESLLPHGPTSLNLAVKLTTRKELNWESNGQISMSKGDSSIWIDPLSSMGAFPGLDIGKILQLNAIALALQGEIDKVVAEKLQSLSNSLNLKKFVSQIESSGVLAIPEVRIGSVLISPKVPVAVTEIQAYPVRGDDRCLRVNLTVVGVNATEKTGGEVTITPTSGQAPTPKLVGEIVRATEGNKKGQLDLKWSKESWKK